MQHDHLARSLAESALSQGAAAACAIEQGWQIEPLDGPISCSELASVYETRLPLLSRWRSPHSRALANSTEELILNLRAHEGATGIWISLRGDAEHHFAVFCLTGSTQPLGCLRLVSKLEVSSERWKELWESVDPLE